MKLYFYQKALFFHIFLYFWQLKKLKKMRQIINHFTDDDLYKLTMCCAVIDNYPRAHVCYQFVDRDDTVYPKGFAQEVEHQIELLETVIITDEEINFLRKKCNYLPEWFLTYLRGFRFSRNWVKVWQNEEGHLHIEIEGLWADTILLEVKILAIISELFYMFNKQAQEFDYQELYDNTYHKTERLLEAGCVFSDFGTRRRASLVAEETAVRAMKDCYDSKEWKGRFVGTSNIHLAMKYDLTPVRNNGTRVYLCYRWYVWSSNGQLHGYGGLASDLSWSVRNLFV